MQVFKRPVYQVVEPEQFSQEYDERLMKLCEGNQHLVKITSLIQDVKKIVAAGFFVSAIPNDNDRVYIRNSAGKVLAQIVASDE